MTRVDVVDVADPAEVLAVGADGGADLQQAAVGTGDAGGGGAGGLDEPDHVGVDLAEQRHAHHVHHALVGDPQPADEAGLHAERVGQARDLGAAAVDDDRAQPDEVQQGDVGRERALELLVDHGVAAVLDHDRLAVEPGDPRQGLAQHGRLALRGSLARCEEFVCVGAHVHVV